MQHFVDSHGAFSFPESLFPSVADVSATASAQFDNLPTASQRKSLLLARAPGNAQIDAILRAPQAGNHAVVLDWCRKICEFHDLWGQITTEMLDLVRRLLISLARHNSSDAAYILGSWGSLKLNPADPQSPELVEPQERRNWLRQALKASMPGAWYRVAMNASDRGDLTQALSRFQRGAEKQDFPCLYTIGLAHLQGQFGFPTNIDQGLAYIELAASGATAEFSRAPYLLGKIWIGEGGNCPGGLGIAGLDSRNFSGKTADGLGLIARSAELGFGPALLRTAEMYAGASQTPSGNGGERGFDAGIALRYLSLASCQDTYRRFRGLPPLLLGKPESQIVKWLLCGYENVVQRSETWAYRFAEVGAQDQDPGALFALAYFSEVGIATAQDAKKATALYKLSASKGFEPAIARLDQVKTGQPMLQRSLTKRDHANRMQKHKQALMQGTLSATDAINDESTLDNGPDNLTAPGGHPVLLPYPDTPVDTPLASPQINPLPSDRLDSVPSLAPSSDSIRSVLPYPTADGGTPYSTPSLSESSFSINSNLRSHSVSPTNIRRENATPLPYPDDADEEREHQRFHTPPVSTGSALTGPVLRPAGAEVPPPIPQPIAEPSNEEMSVRMQRTRLSDTTPSDLATTGTSPSVNTSANSPPVPQLNPISQPSSQAVSRQASRSPEMRSSPSMGSVAAETSQKTKKPRPKSSQWVQSMGSRIFSPSSSSSNLASSSSSDLTGSSPALVENPARTSRNHKHSSSLSLGEQKRSISPLRKIFGSTPEQRAAAARADRRSFTEAALAELASAPKVPVQPIKTERVPGVAYTFEEMGIKTVSSAKRDRCVVM